MDTKVLVIGQLGELVKKIYELEQALDTNPKNEIAMLSLFSYNRVLESWPVDDGEFFSYFVMDLKLALSKLVTATEEFEASVKSESVRMHLDAWHYITAKQVVKDKMAQINAIGRYVGNVPVINLKEQGASNDLVTS